MPSRLPTNHDAGILVCMMLASFPSLCCHPCLHPDEPVSRDLKRDLAPKMAKLEKRSKRAIAEIIRTLPPLPLPLLHSSHYPPAGSRLQNEDEAAKFAELKAKAGTN